jgi:putative transposase
MSVRNRQRRPVDKRGHGHFGVDVYFITIRTFRNDCIFGEVRNGIMGLNENGLAVRRAWREAEKTHRGVLFGEFIVMPNHFHAIVWIAGERTTNGGTKKNRGTAHRAPTFDQFGKPVDGSLPTFIRSFKSISARRINALHDTAGAPVWQRKYSEHIPHDLEEIDRIEERIRFNPAHWAADEENPHHLE